MSPITITNCDHCHHHSPTTSPTSTTPTTDPPTTTPSPATKLPPTTLTAPQTLPAPSTLFPPGTLDKKAVSTTTTGNADKPVVEVVGPFAMAGGKDGKWKGEKVPRMKNGYVPKGYMLCAETGGLVKKPKTKPAGAGAVEAGNGEGSGGVGLPPGVVIVGGTSAVGKTKAQAGGKKKEMISATEKSLSTTKDVLAGGAKRTVWVQTERRVTVVIEPVGWGEGEEDEDEDEDEDEGEETIQGGVTKGKARREARRAAGGG